MMNSNLNLSALPECKFAYIDRCNCYHPDGKEEKPAHPCAGGFQPGL